jgi:Zn-dependent peptidase ImmA (M78 family)/transcriptional regulator with XRE-family HTH domain
MLAWAREDSGYTLESASEKTRFTIDRLTAWEHGEEKPTIPQLRKLADTYRRPLAAFFMPDPPPGFQPMTDFRRMPESEDLRWTPALRALIRRARAQQRIYASLLDELGEDRPGLAPAPESDDPELVGQFARETLGVGLEEQWSWRDEGSALRGWTRAVEAHGVLTLHTSTTRGQTISTDEMLGFSDPDPIPIVVLNGRDHARRRTFTLLHEYAHLLVRRAGVCDLHDRYTTADFDPTEVFCNAVAAAMLMPQEAFLQDDTVRRGRGNPEWEDSELGGIARRFTTSREAVLRRLLTLGLTTENYYRSWRERYYREWEPAEGQESGGGFANYYQLKVRELGLPYTTTVIEAYNQDTINASDLARFLNIKIKNLPGVEDEVVKALSRSS